MTYTEEKTLPQRSAGKPGSAVLLATSTNVNRCFKKSSTNELQSSACSVNSHRGVTYDVDNNLEASRTEVRYYQANEIMETTTRFNFATMMIYGNECFYYFESQWALRQGALATMIAK